MKSAWHRIGIASWWGLNLITIPFTLTAAYGGMVNPATTTLPAIMAMTYPAWALLTIGLLGISLAVRPLRKAAILPGVVILLSLPATLSYAPVNLHIFSKNDADAGNTFSVMSYNVYGLVDIYADKDAAQHDTAADTSNPTAAYLLKRDADIMFLQEFPGFNPKKRDFTYPRAQADSLEKRYPYVTAESQEYLLSRFPFKPIELRQPSDPYSWFTAAVADIEGHETLLVCVHLQSIGLTGADKELYRDLTDGEGRGHLRRARQQLLGKLSHAFRERASEARLLRAQIDSLAINNVIVAGDFNDIPGCYAMRTICGDDFHNAFSDAALGPIITYHANRFYFHIDHILYRGDMEAVEFKRGECPNSDHYAVETVFRWKN